MRLATLTLAAVTLMTAGSALAADRVTDVDYLKANRCRGLAEVSAADTTDLDAWLKAAGRTRTSVVVSMGANEQDRARREAKTTNAERKTRLAAELSGPCQAFKG
ncbi:hypothetical protein [Phenylobacterium sp.]|uniref:hypothetical protein n=1 Tax=Phenylobacterium sp. TaxID=1871053 RepID=UPI0027260D09|nr:hypothetical protein [Phenylobacterium sp.]MDO8381091.1 hypothetical protein [Phenylobacterium sp.]